MRKNKTSMKIWSDKYVKKKANVLNLPESAIELHEINSE